MRSDKARRTAVGAWKAPRTVTDSIAARASSGVTSSAMRASPDDLHRLASCCDDKCDGLAHDIEVGSSHIELGCRRDVLSTVSDRLGQQA